MVATISPVDSQYHHTVNTLKYADRAKEIRTHIQKNIGTVDTHVSDYQRMIDNLQIEVCRLKKELAEKESQLSIKPAEKAADDELSWLDILSHEISENVQDRINLQKALFELEEVNIRIRSELQHLDEAIAKYQATEKDEAVVEALRARRQVILDNIRDNDEAGVNYQKEIEANESHRCELQDMIDEAISNNGNKTYLLILSQYRILGMANIELQFEMALRDQVIHNQRETQRNMWKLLMTTGIDEKRLLNLAAKKGITNEDWNITSQVGLPNNQQSPNLAYGRYYPVGYSPLIGHSYPRPSCIFPQCDDLSSRSLLPLDLAPTFFTEDRNSYYLLSHDHSPSAHVRLRKSSELWTGCRPVSWCGTPSKSPQDICNSCPEIRTQALPYKASHESGSPGSADFGRRRKDMWRLTQKQNMLESPRVGKSCWI